MENWDNIRFILALHRHRTMSAAAMALNTNVATVSRRIERASQHFGAPLFLKDANGWTATDAALPLLRVAEEFDARLSVERHARLAAVSRGIEARLQIAAPPFFNTVVLLPHFHKLLTEHPGLVLDFRNRVDATGLGEADVMLRINRPESGRVVARRLATLTMRGYRSTGSDMQMPGWIAVEARTGNTSLNSFGEQLFGCAPSVSVSLFEQKLTVMRTTGLAAVLADEVASQLPDMVPIDPDAPTLPVEIWMVYHASRRDDPAVRVVTDWIVACFRGGRLGEVQGSEELVDVA